MPRKKSAAKKAKDQEVSIAEVPIQDSLFDEADDDEEEFTINKEYALRFEHNKKREDLHRLQEKYKGANLDDDDEDDSTSEEEDDTGDLNNPQIDAAILKILSKIKNKDPELYTTEAKFFEDAERDAVASKTHKVKEAKPTRIADVHRETLLAGKGNADYNGEDSDDEMEGADSGPTHVQEQSALRNAFRDVGEEADSDDELFVPRKKSAVEAKQDDEEYQAFLSEQLGNGTSDNLLAQLKIDAENPEGEEFLMNYVLNRGWIDKDAQRVPSYDQVVDSDEEFADWEERAEKFETNYNFRFEQPGATEITTHPRDVQSVRRKDEKRKKERETKSIKENSAKQERLEELNRLRNLKKAEFEEKIRKIEEVTGRRMDFDEIDLEGDFDPDQWDQKMIDRFNDEYYGEEEKKPVWDDDIDIADLGIPESDNESDGATKLKAKKKKSKSATDDGLTKREEKSRKRKLEALVDASLPQSQVALGNPTGTVFKYSKSEPESFGLTVEDILFADDKDLNEFVGLKKLAAYKPLEKREADRKKYGAKKRVKQFQKQLWSKSQWAERSAANNEALGGTVPGTEDEGRRKRKKKNKSAAI